MPIVVLSVLDEEEQKVLALQAGADDYLTKPFSARELVARLEAVFRRVTEHGEEPTIPRRGAWRSTSPLTRSSETVAR